MNAALQNDFFFLVSVSVYLYQYTDLARGVPEIIHICKTMFSATAKKSCLKDVTRGHQQYVNKNRI